MGRKTKTNGVSEIHWHQLERREGYTLQGASTIRSQKATSSIIRTQCALPLVHCRNHRSLDTHPSADFQKAWKYPPNRNKANHYTTKKNVCLVLRLHRRRGMEVLNALSIKKFIGMCTAGGGPAPPSYVTPAGPS